MSHATETGQHLVGIPSTRQVFCYELTFTNGLLMTNGAATVAAQNVEARWVAVDGIGNLCAAEPGKGDTFFSRSVRPLSWVHVSPAGEGSENEILTFCLPCGLWLPSSSWLP